MKYKVHKIEIDLEKDQEKLENFLNNLKGEVVSIIPNIAKTTLFQIYGATRKINFILIVEKLKELHQNTTTAVRALNLKTGSLLTKEALTFNSETFGALIRYLLESTKGEIHLIMDNAKWHRAKDFKDVFESNQDRLIRIFLPSY
ncbi:transposase [Chloroflexota bacterium]